MTSSSTNDGTNGQVHLDGSRLTRRGALIAGIAGLGVLAQPATALAQTRRPSVVPTGDKQAQGVVDLDSFDGATDDDKLTAALQYVGSQTNMPAIQLPGRNVTFSKARTPFSGLRIYGASGDGPKNLELSSGKFVPAKVTLNCGQAWWTGTGTYYDICFTDIAFQYGGGTSFWAQPSGTLYACEFHSLTHYGAVGVFGSAGTKALLTQVIFSGHWTVQGAQDTQFHIGGSDNNFWTDGYLNIQGPSSPAGAGRPQLYFDSVQKTNVANMYVTCVHGWRGIKVTGGSGGYGLNFTGCRTEGANPSNPCDGTAFQVAGGGVSIRDHWAACAMVNPGSSEHGIVEVTGGDVSVDRICYYRGNTAATVPLVHCSGGTLRINSAASSTGDTLYVAEAGGRVVADSSVKVT